MPNVPQGDSFWVNLATSILVLLLLAGAYSYFAGGPAAKAGVKEGDLLIAAGDQPLTGLDDLLRALDHHAINKPTLFTLIREGRLMTVSITPRVRKRS